MRQNILKASAYAFAALAIVAFASPGFAQGRAGGSSGTHMSTQGSANTNGPTATDRDKGKARSMDRKNTEGTAHGKAKAKGKTKTE